MILDLMMPIMDGFQVLEEIRSGRCGNKDLPIIILSALNREEDVNRAMSLGANDFVKTYKTENEDSFVKEEKSTNLNTNDIQMPQHQIVNIVSVVDLGTKLRLREIALQCSNSEYNPSRINAVVMRIKTPKAAALIFNTGIMIVLGAKDKEISKKAAKIFAKSIKQLGFEVKLKNFKIVNIVATCDLGFPIKLTNLSLELNAKLNNNSKDKDKKICYYESEIFPGLIYHMRKPELTLLVFQSGKMNFVGAKNKDDIFNALEKVYPLLCKYKNEIIMNKNKDKNKEISDLTIPEFSDIINL
jgi:transcription initiation factor TFIID TATA-box-binding protein